MTILRYIDDSKLEFFRRTLLNWFEEHGMEYPWRGNSTPIFERILSELLLQRTKAKVVSEFLPGFIKEYPSWQALAESPRTEIENRLIPLGLATQKSHKLKSLSKQMVQLKGKLPQNLNEIIQLPMIGQYLGYTLLCLIYNKVYPMLDFNMARVLERFFGPRNLADIRYDPYLQSLAFLVVNVDHPKQMNWAILDFAHQVCKSRKPDCHSCPINVQCEYYLNIKT